MLLDRYLPRIEFDSYEDFKKIEDKLPEVFSLRADAKTGEQPTLRS